MSSYRAALCDDEAADRVQIAELCRDIFTAWGMDAEVIPFSTADELRRRRMRRSSTCTCWTSGWRDLRAGAGPAVLQPGHPDRIIFITGDPEFALEGYDVEPLHYLLKPVGRSAGGGSAAGRREVGAADRPVSVGRKDGGPSPSGDPLSGEPGPRRGGLPGGA